MSRRPKTARRGYVAAKPGSYAEIATLTLSDTERRQWEARIGTLASPVYTYSERDWGVGKTWVRVFDTLTGQVRAGGAIGDHRISIERISGATKARDVVVMQAMRAAGILPGEGEV